MNHREIKEIVSESKIYNVANNSSKGDKCKSWDNAIASGALPKKISIVCMFYCLSFS